MNILGVLASSIKTVSLPPAPTYPYPLNASEALLSALTGGAYGKLTPSVDEQTGSVILDVGLTTNNKALVGSLSAEVPAPEFVFLNDMSIGQGAFGFEVHVTFPKTNAPLVSPLGFAGVQLRDTVNPNKFFQIGGFTGSSGLPVSGETSVNSVLLYDDGGVKRFSLWGNGVTIISGANLADIPTTVGLDLSALFVFMYIEAGVNPLDANKFVDENPTISCRFVTNPSEMVYGPSVFPAGTKTIVRDGIIVL